MELIDKDALVAEIKRRIDEINQLGKNASYEVGLVDAYKIMLSFLDTLEVKEVDLEEEDAFIEEAIGWIDYNNRNGGCLFDGWEKDFRKYMKGE